MFHRGRENASGGQSELKTMVVELYGSTPYEDVQGKMESKVAFDADQAPRADLGGHPAWGNDGTGLELFKAK